ncbi:hypothetical protein KKA00_10265 [bacterium]|nr:hypothetical protein [bacterium]MBU1652594.1 hypothetical protein [bacterium]MBU1880520.1 hypothetical protein [bacterium]
MQKRLIAITGQDKDGGTRIKHTLASRGINATFHTIDLLQLEKLSPGFDGVVVQVRSMPEARSIASIFEKQIRLPPTIAILCKGLRYASYQPILNKVPLFREPSTNEQWNNLGRVIGVLMLQEQTVKEQPVKRLTKSSSGFTIYPNATRCDALRSSGAVAGALTVEFDRALHHIAERVSSINKALKHDIHISSDLEAIECETKNASRVTTQLRSMLNGETGLHGSVDLNQLLREIVPLVKSILGNLIPLTLELYPGSLPLSGDRLQLQRALFNIFINAKDALGKEGALRIRTGKLNYEDSYDLGLVEAKNGSVWIAIQDTGLGMTTKVRESLFKPFFSTKPVHEHPGLGMIMVKHILDQHQGIINIDSQAGRGTTITFHFPALPITRGVATKSGTAEDEARSVLVICHEPVMLQLLTDVLQREQYRALHTNRLWEGIELLYEHRHEIEIVILHASPSDTDMKELVERVQQIHKEAKIIIIQSQSIDSDVEAPDSQNVRYLYKPFRLKHLLESIELLRKGSGAGN